MDNIFIGLGSNLEKPLLQLKKAIEHLKHADDINLVDVSSFYASPPMGPQDQPDYINAVVKISTNLTAEQLLDKCQNIENKQGRVRLQRWGARTLDLDILLFGQEVINTERLIIPHRGISERNFVLYPLSDLVTDDFVIPQLGKISQLLTACSIAGVTRLCNV